MCNAILMIQHEDSEIPIEVELERPPSVTYEPIEVSTIGGKVTTPTYENNFLNYLLGIAGQPKPGVTKHKLVGRAICEPMQITIYSNYYEYFRNWLHTIDMFHSSKRSGCLIFNGNKMMIDGMFPTSIEHHMPINDMDTFTIEMFYDKFTITESE